jgi:hypothetical protein
MGTDFPEFQEVLRFALQILPTDSQRIQNAADDKNSAPKTQETNGVQLQGVHSPLQLLNSKNLLSQNKIDHIQLNRLHHLSKMRRREALWKTINIQQKLSQAQMSTYFY